jgi:hypothetical protein
MTWPAGAVETRSHESNADVNSVGGTIIDADDQNWVYDLLEALQVKVGSDLDTSAAASVEGRLKALEALDPLLNPLTTTGDLMYSSDDDGTAARLGIGTTGQILTVTAGLPAWADAPESGFDNPMDSAGDLIYGTTGGAAARLGIGSAGQFLGISGGLPAWATPNYIPAPGSPSQGDVLYYSGSGWTRLGPGTTGQFLQTLGVSSNPQWATPPSAAPGDGIPAPVGQAQGDVFYYNGTDWVGLAAGTAGEFLKTNGASANPEWATPAGGGDMDNPMTTLSDLIYADTGGTPLRLPIGTNGTILTVVAGAPAWASTSLVAVPDYVTAMFYG